MPEIYLRRLNGQWEKYDRTYKRISYGKKVAQGMVDSPYNHHLLDASRVDDKNGKTVFLYEREKK